MNDTLKRSQPFRQIGGGRPGGYCRIDRMAGDGTQAPLVLPRGPLEKLGKMDRNGSGGLNRSGFPVG